MVKGSGLMKTTHLRLDLCYSDFVHHYKYGVTDNRALKVESVHKFLAKI